jgi:hypothetical protein
LYTDIGLVGSSSVCRKPWDEYFSISKVALLVCYTLIKQEFSLELAKDLDKG